VVDGVSVPELTRRLVEAGIGVQEVTPERNTLEGVVLSLTGPGSDRIDGRSTGSGGSPDATGSPR
jgi:hypothetical protein